MGLLCRGSAGVGVALSLWAGACLPAAATPGLDLIERTLMPPAIALVTEALLAIPVLVGLGAFYRWHRSRRQLGREALDRDRKITRLTSGAHPDPAVGTAFGAWRIVDRLGSSRVSTVYKAVPDGSLDEREAVALKIFKVEADHDPDVVERFRHAVRTAQSLRHPATIEVLAHGEHGGRLYIVREYIHGYPLRNRVRPGGMEIPEFFHIIRQVADALQHAHEHELMHFDLKPDNIVIYGVLKIKIVDFGLDVFEAKARSDYTAPELVVGEAVDGRADQYAFGVLLYEMLTGHTPLRETHGGILPPSSHRHDLPLETDSVVLRMLAESPAQRFPSVATALDALEDALGARAEEGIAEGLGQRGKSI